jgi:16S rRNA (cytosine967-C5)-methyltransferase
LIYCVCSLEPQEGEAHLGWLRERDDVDVSPIQPAELAGLEAAVQPDGTVRTRPGLALPGDNPGTLDGFFVARLVHR